ncbi:MAG: hypothetical protein GQE15_30010 [Archangiaceae bacterium]|nr:hypothetical protein [Archangiaceae bacterium]
MRRLEAASHPVAPSPLTRPSAPIAPTPRPSEIKAPSSFEPAKRPMVAINMEGLERAGVTTPFSKAPKLSPGPRPLTPPGGKPTKLTVEVPFVSQWTLNNPKKACLRACQAMLAEAGLRDRGAAKTLWLNGSSDLGLPATSNAQLRAQIDADLEAGKPVVVGVNRPGGRNENRDGVTDHWIVVTGKGVDAEGREFYTFHDPGRRSETNGSDQNPANRLYVDEATGGLYSLDANGDRRYDLTAVRTSEAA